MRDRNTSLTSLIPPHAQKSKSLLRRSLSSSSSRKNNGACSAVEYHPEKPLPESKRQLARSMLLPGELRGAALTVNEGQIWVERIAVFGEEACSRYNTQRPESLAAREYHDHEWRLTACA